MAEQDLPCWSTGICPALGQPPHRGAKGKNTGSSLTLPCWAVGRPGCSCGTLPTKAVLCSWDPSLAWLWLRSPQQPPVCADGVWQLQCEGSKFIPETKLQHLVCQNCPEWTSSASGSAICGDSCSDTALPLGTEGLGLVLLSGLGGWDWFCSWDRGARIGFHLAKPYCCSCVFQVVSRVELQMPLFE